MDERSELRRLAAACAAALSVAFGVSSAAQTADQDVEDDAERPAVRSCVNHPSIRRTRILNNRNIVFVMRDQTIYNNELPEECPSLKRGSLVNYPVQSGRLCEGGSFQVLWEAGPGNYVPAFLCQLGTFVPITEAELEDLTAMTEENRERRRRGRSAREAVTTEQVELPRDPAPAPPATGDDARSAPQGEP